MVLLSLIVSLTIVTTTTCEVQMDHAKKLATASFLWECAKMVQWNGSTFLDTGKFLSAPAKGVLILIIHPPSPTLAPARKMNITNVAVVFAVGVSPMSSSSPLVWPGSQATFSGNIVQMVDLGKFVW